MKKFFSYGIKTCNERYSAYFYKLKADISFILFLGIALHHRFLFQEQSRFIYQVKE